MPRKMVLSSGPCNTEATPEELMRATSWTGAGNIRSSSPDSRAAVRVASEPMGVMTTSVTLKLWLAMSHQSLLRVSTVFTPGSRLTSLKGPVPLAWRVA